MVKMGKKLRIIHLLSINRRDKRCILKPQCRLHGKSYFSFFKAFICAREGQRFRCRDEHEHMLAPVHARFYSVIMSMLLEKMCCLEANPWFLQLKISLFEQVTDLFGGIGIASKKNLHLFIGSRQRNNNAVLGEFDNLRSRTIGASYNR